MDKKKSSPTADIPVELSVPIGQVIKTWRERRGWSVTELAEKTQLTKGYISQLEHNKIKRPNDQHLAKLAGALGIEVWDLIARRMPTNKYFIDNRDELDNDSQGAREQDISPPFGSGAFHFPQSGQTRDQLEEEALIEDLQGLLRILHTRELSHEQRAEYIELIRSFFAWLEFRMTRNPE